MAKSKGGEERRRVERPKQRDRAYNDMERNQVMVAFYQFRQSIRRERSWRPSEKAITMVEASRLENWLLDDMRKWEANDDVR